MEFPRPRSGATIFVYEDQLMVWGGMTQVFFGEGDDRFLVSKDLPEEHEPVLEVLDLNTYEWRKERTYGDPIPFMGKSSYHVLFDDTLYLFGGCSKIYHNDLFKLNLLDYHWQKVYPSQQSVIPSPTCEGGSGRFGTSIYTYGGKGAPLTNIPESQSESCCGASFKSNLNFGYLCDDGWHNALYEYNIIESNGSYCRNS